MENWVSVKDRLPSEDWPEVLCKSPDQALPFKNRYYPNLNTWDTLAEVTHWKIQKEQR